MSIQSQFTVSGYDQQNGEINLKVVNAEESSWRLSVKIKNCGKISTIGKNKYIVI